MSGNSEEKLQLASPQLEIDFDGEPSSSSVSPQTDSAQSVTNGKVIEVCDRWEQMSSAKKKECFEKSDSCDEIVTETRDADIERGSPGKKR